MRPFPMPNMMTKDKQGPNTLPYSLLACPLLHLNQVTQHLLQVPAGPVSVLRLAHCTQAIAGPKQGPRPQASPVASSGAGEWAGAG